MLAHPAIVAVFAAHRNTRMVPTPTYIVHNTHISVFFHCQRMALAVVAVRPLLALILAAMAA